MFSVFFQENVKQDLETGKHLRETRKHFLETGKHFWKTGKKFQETIIPLNKYIFTKHWKKSTLL